MGQGQSRASQGQSGVSLGQVWSVWGQSGASLEWVRANLRPVRAPQEAQTRECGQTRGAETDFRAPNAMRQCARALKREIVATRGLWCKPHARAETGAHARAETRAHAHAHAHARARTHARARAAKRENGGSAEKPSLTHPKILK